MHDAVEGFLQAFESFPIGVAGRGLGRFVHRRRHGDGRRSGTRRPRRLGELGRHHGRGLSPGLGGGLGRGLRFGLARHHAGLARRLGPGPWRALGAGGRARSSRWPGRQRRARLGVSPSERRRRGLRELARFAPARGRRRDLGHRVHGKLESAGEQEDDEEHALLHRLTQRKPRSPSRWPGSQALRLAARGSTK